MASIFIYKEKKSFIRRFLNNLNTFGCLGFSFYFNYKFIGGNDFFDSIIFIFFIISASGIIMTEGKKHFFEVSDKKIKKIEDILKNE
jgi:hypothetical protein